MSGLLDFTAIMSGFVTILCFGAITFIFTLLNDLRKKTEGIVTRAEIEEMITEKLETKMLTVNFHLENLTKDVKAIHEILKQITKISVKNYSKE